MLSISTSGYNIAVRMTLWPIQHWLILICFDLLTHLNPMLTTTNSSHFGNTSTSLIRTHSFMDRLTLLLSIIKRVGTEFVNLTGTFSNPIVIFFTTPFRALMCQLIRFRLMLVRTLLSIVPLYRVTSSPRHNAIFIPHISGFTINKRTLVPLPPQFFSFLHHILWAPLGCDEWLPRNSMKTLKFTSHVSLWTDGDVVLFDPYLSPPSRYDSDNLINYFLSCLKGLSP